MSTKMSLRAPSEKRLDSDASVVGSDRKISDRWLEQYSNITFCVKLGKSMIEILQRLTAAAIYHSSNSKPSVSQQNIFPFLMHVNVMLH
jgi:hypothetical protein